MSDDPYVYPGTDVLRNIPGIHDRDELEGFEARLTFLRDGNGRAQRAFFAQLASDAGYRLDWQLVEPQVNIDASIAAMQGDEEPMRRLLDEITHPVD